MFNKLIRKFISWLYRALEEEKARIKQQAEALIVAARDEKQKHLARQYLELQNKRWGVCRHLKGGKVHGPKPDYSLRYHIFSDGSEEIQCTICGKPWTKQSPDWKQALEMMHQSTNTVTSSERTFKIKDQIEPTPVYVVQTEDGNVPPFTGKLAPFVSDSYVERVWNKLYKKLTRKKKLDKTKKS
jgi:hypothetical protein